ncbi:hypothetical protein OEB99_13780 [Actinotalea sp. M2MS4P-6]|uniref:hypothetical protein n=1 Tax=Actinotalea sp. M2MS4P-6 TaxID=2983762 RepID=UPI0021E3EFBB|nr:hypothetical protein [Actinotalea sp. M2MS4P-6]MCV2395382.1 hypothetical protein [Actinotalea sp. M2MS4P-6]
MSPVLRTATCEDCEWHVSGSSAWSAADIHESDTGHTVRRAGAGTPGDVPDPYTEPHEDEPTA